MIRPIFFALLCLSLGLSCKEEKPKVPVKAKTITFIHEAQLDLIKGEDSIIKSLEIELAETEYERQTGLMYRSSMAHNRGMLFIFDKDEYRSFYMKNTEIGLDIIYINDALEIVSIQANAEPYNESSLPSNAPARYVLEINAGLAATWGIAVGDKIRFSRL